MNSFISHLARAMLNSEDTTTRVCSVLLGSLLVVLSFWEMVCEQSSTMRMVIAYMCVWIGSLLVKRSLHTSRQPPSQAPIMLRPLRRRQASSSTCPKPITPTAPIRVVSVRGSKISPRRRVSGHHQDTEPHISSYNNESFMTVSTECTSGSPKSEEVGLSSPLQVPDSIAAIWEPVDEPTSSKLW